LRVGYIENLILDNITLCEERGYPPPFVSFRKWRLTWEFGIPILGIRNRIFGVERITASEKASFSRALRSLEKKGLIKTRNHVSEKPYRTHVALTDKGRNFMKERGWSLNVNFPRKRST